ncbi:hypothetical protein Q3W71_19215 [Micromonospora sp. C28SCA-DRY-2]|uniref:hypothetical protein n=1 Tax=Micromonospora sp. C28SCA-DRY-2 TaxID=3059522 RepID=UPI0026762F68|nr:hypothetical protein [Micromonospora sp. C28SCA-DRY-2]MDO3703800.1 hypothetical protein [Micromonospora sp. C28SCA-DRY-2]
MNSGARIGMAVGFGYLLGRRRKLRTALTLAAAVAIGRASRDPGGLLGRAGGLLQSSPHLSNLSHLGKPLASAGKAAATAAASSGIDAVSGKLRGSADALRRRAAGQSDGGGRPDDTDQPDTDQPDTGQADAGQPDTDEDQPQRETARSGRRGR